ncbi:SRPBCC family protein [Synechococcus sp. W4D4]|uniref:SRPBCC family protein n=1 Tax=Synechococcus sp. W4D4 TaxID=3392294 RepID=UPI0039EB4E51
MATSSQLALGVAVLLTSGQAIAKPILRGSQGDYVVTEFVGTTPQRAWAVLTNFNSQAEWAPDISQTKVLKRSGTNFELQQTYRAGYTFGLPIKARLSVQETPPKGFSYRLIQGDRLNTLQGSWSIQPVAGGVQLKHQMQVDPQVPGPLRPFYYEQQEQNLRQWMTILKRRMEAN